MKDNLIKKISKIFIFLFIGLGLGFVMYFIVSYLSPILYYLTGIVFLLMILTIYLFSSKVQN